MRYLILAAALLICMPGFSKAAEIPQMTTFSERFFNRSDYVDPWKMHVRFSWTHPLGKEDYTVNGVPDPAVGFTSGQPNEKNMMGGEISFERFLTDYMSVELGSGYQFSKSMMLIFTNTDTGKIANIPVDFSFNIHPMPYGTIDPYIGIGYGYNYSISSFENVDISDSSGMFLKAGFDWLMYDNMSFNVDVKKKFYSIDTDYSKASVPDIVKSKTDSNPVIVSAGVGFKF